jgi:hypothetical protein
MQNSDGQDADDQDSDGTDLFTGSLTIRVATVSPPNVIAATVTPLNLATSAPELTAIVGWEGILTLSSTVRLEADSHLWSRLVHLLWAVLGPDTAPEPAEFAAGAWSSVVLSTQELDGPLHHSVLVVVERDDWSARLIRSNRNLLGLELPIPVELRSLDAGSVLVEMTSRLLVGQSWLWPSMSHG